MGSLMPLLPRGGMEARPVSKNHLASEQRTRSLAHAVSRTWAQGWPKPSTHPQACGPRRFLSSQGHFYICFLVYKIGATVSTSEDHLCSDSQLCLV